MTNEQVKVINILTREHDYPFGKAAWIAEEELYKFHSNLIDLIDECVEDSVYIWACLNGLVLTTYRCTRVTLVCYLISYF